MSGSGHGDNTSPVEVTNISAHGISLASHGKELFMSYENFPWFREQPVSAILKVQEPTRGHYHWPMLDIDLTDEIIRFPDRFPLVADQT
ncbi:MAG: DUF2442 domain-containing protein [Pseudomonadota bacterium]